MGSIQCSCNTNIKEIILSNDMKIDDAMQNFTIRHLQIDELDSQIREIIKPTQVKYNHDLVLGLINRICETEIVMDYSNYFRKWVLNIIGPNYEYSYLLGLILFPLVSNYHSKSSHSYYFTKYVFDYFGTTKNSLSIVIRHIIEINTDYMYNVLRPILERNDDSAYFNLWSINRKNSLIDKLMNPYRKLYNANLDELNKLDTFDHRSEDFALKSSEARQRSMFQYFERYISSLNGTQIRNCLIRDYFNEISKDN